MNELVTRARKERLKEQRHSLKKKRVLATLEIILFTSLLITAVYLFLDNTKAKAIMEKYTVQKGDTLFSISNRYHISIKEIQVENKLSSNTIYVGQDLIIPNQSSSNNHIVKKGETIYSIAKDYELSVNELKKQNQLKANTIFIGQTLIIRKQEKVSQLHKETIETINIQEANKGLSEFYTVMPGDTLWNISQRFGIPFTQLKRENRLSANHIETGQKLYISGEKHFSTGIVIGAADNTTVEFYVYGEPLPLKVSHGTAMLFQKIANKEFFITYKNGALISYY